MRFSTNSIWPGTSSCIVKRHNDIRVLRHVHVTFVSDLLRKCTLRHSHRMNIIEYGVIPDWKHEKWLRSLPMGNVILIVRHTYTTIDVCNYVTSVDNSPQSTWNCIFFGYKLGIGLGEILLYLALQIFIKHVCFQCPSRSSPKEKPICDRWCHGQIQEGTTG